MDSHVTNSESAHEHHGSALGLYITIYLILMALLVLTVWVAYINIGIMALPVALTIAFIKAILVIIYFMHMRYTGKLMWLYTAIGFVWLAMLLFGVLVDVFMRTR